MKRAWSWICAAGFAALALGYWTMSVWLPLVPIPPWLDGILYSLVLLVESTERYACTRALRERYGRAVVPR